MCDVSSWFGGNQEQPKPPAAPIASATGAEKSGTLVGEVAGTDAISGTRPGKKKRTNVVGLNI